MSERDLSKKGGGCSLPIASGQGEGGGEHCSLWRVGASQGLEHPECERGDLSVIELGSRQTGMRF